MRVKMYKQPPPAPIASAVSPCPTVIQIVGRPGTGSLPRTIAPPDHPLLNQKMDFEIIIQECFLVDPLPKLLKRFCYVEQNGHHGYK